MRYAIRLARLVAERYGLPLDGHGDFRFVDLEGTAAGRVTIRGSSYFIELDKKYRGDLPGTASILAHEFAHVLLAQRRVCLDSTYENERLTDTVAALAGFGSIMRQAVERVRLIFVGVGWVERTHYLGYLNRDDLGWLCGLQERIAHRRPLRVLATADPAWRPYAPCPGCASRLRLPRRTARVHLTCPVCGLVQDLNLALGARRQSLSWYQRLVEVMRAHADARNGVPS